MNDLIKVLDLVEKLMNEGKSYKEIGNELKKKQKTNTINIGEILDLCDDVRNRKRGASVFYL